MSRHAVSTRLVRSPFGGLLLCALMVLRAPGGPPAPPQAVGSGEAAAPNGPAALILEDVPEPLVPEHPRTTADEDRVEALALFAAARIHQQRQQYDEALRLYQRALRRDPEAVTVARAIIPLAFALKRYDQAARYALKLEPGDLEDADPRLLRDLAVRLTKQAEWDRAAQLYERVLAAWVGAKETAADVLLRMEMGRLYFLAGRHGKAADSFARVLHALKHPQEFGLGGELQKMLVGEAGATYHLFGECFLQADRADEALAAFEKAHQITPDEGRLHFNLARVHSHRGKPDLALSELEACFKQHLASEGMAPFELLAEVLGDLGKQEELLPRLEKLRADDPQNVPLGYFLAGQYLDAQQLAKAEPLYLALLKEAPTLTGYRSLVEIYRKSGRAEGLLSVLGEAVEKTGALETLGSEARAVAGDAELMRAVVETARKKYQAEAKKLDFGMRFAVALLALESKQPETAAEFFDLALKAKPEQAAELLLVWGRGLLFEERSADAVEVFRRAIDEKALPEDYPVFSFYLASALAMDDRTDEALAAAEKAVEMARGAAGKAAEEALAAEKALAAANEAGKALAQEKAMLAAQMAAGKKEDLARFSSRVGWVLYHAKRHDPAIAAYRKVIDQFDSDHESRGTREVLREVRLALSNLYVLREDLAEAEEWLEQVLDEFPDDPGASNDLGYLWADQDKHLQRALKMIRLAVDAEPENVAYRDSLGWAYYRLERYQEAVVELQKALQQQKEIGEEPDPVILDHLGDAHRQANQPQEARDAWRRAAESFRKQEQPEKVKTVEKKIQKPD